MDDAKFRAALNAWLVKNSLSFYAAAPILGTTERTVSRWAKGVHRCKPKDDIRRKMREYRRD